MPEPPDPALDYSADEHTPVTELPVHVQAAVAERKALVAETDLELAQTENVRLHAELAAAAAELALVKKERDAALREKSLLALELNRARRAPR